MLNNAECLFCKGWFTPEKKKNETWEDLQKTLIEKLKNKKK